MSVIYRAPGEIDDTRSVKSGRRLAVRQYLWDQIIDLMIGEPGITQLEIARRMGKTPTWVSYISHSDAFKDLLRTRRAEFNQTLAVGLNEALTRVAHKGIDLLEKKLDNPAAVSPALALEVVDRTLERLGYGVKAGPAVNINNSVNSALVLSAEDFAHAKSLVHEVREALPRSGAVEQERGNAVDVDVVEESIVAPLARDVGDSTLAMLEKLHAAPAGEKL